MDDAYPEKHFPGTPTLVKVAVEKAMLRARVMPYKWRVPLEAIARYESECNPDIIEFDGALRGMMQQSVGQYHSALVAGYIDEVRYRSPVQAVYVAILYIQSDLPGFGGYHGIRSLLARVDRGPGQVLEFWKTHPRATYSEMRRLYRGY